MLELSLSGHTMLIAIRTSQQLVGIQT
jgi:hypothetical protein